MCAIIMSMRALTDKIPLVWPGVWWNPVTERGPSDAVISVRGRVI